MATYRPSDWIFSTADSGTNFTIVHSQTGETFTGTAAEVNAYIIAMQTSADGTGGTLVTVTELGLERSKCTQLDFQAGAVMPAVTGTIGVGKLIYTFPAGEIIVESAAINVGLTGVAGNAANTLSLGLGTVVSSGAIATHTTATFQNILNAVTTVVPTGLRKVTCSPTPIAASPVPLVIATANAHTVYFNVAGIYTGADPGMVLSGRIVLNWRKMS